MNNPCLLYCQFVDAEEAILSVCATVVSLARWTSSTPHALQNQSGFYFERPKSLLRRNLLKFLYGCTPNCWYPVRLMEPSGTVQTVVKLGHGGFRT